MKKSLVKRALTLIDEFCEKFPLSPVTTEFRECDVEGYAEVEIFGEIAEDYRNDLPVAEVQFLERIGV